MFGFLRRKSAELTPKEAKQVEELVSYAEAWAEGGAERAIATALDDALKTHQKNMASVEHFNYLANDDGGNYFAQEFNIQATSVRLKGLYSREPWVYATASLIARALSTVPFKVRHKASGEFIENHPIAAKMKLGSSMQSGKAVETVNNLDFILGGNGFRVFDSTYQKCVHVPLDNVELKIAPDYTHVEGLHIFNPMNAGGVKRFVPMSQVVHTSFPNPYNPFWGMSIFTAASRPLLLDRVKNEFEFAFYLRGGTSQGIVETTEDINKTRMKRLLRGFEQTYTGKRDWWRQIFLPKGSSFKPTGFTFEQLAVLGVPPSKVGIVQDVNRSTSDNQDKDFWTNTVVPLADMVADCWNNSHYVRVVFGDAVEVVPDLSEIEALQGSLKTKGEQATSIKDFFTIDEIRERVFGEGPLPLGRGDRFVAEVRPAASDPFAALGLSAPEPAQGTDPLALPAGEAESGKLGLLEGLKAQATGNQERIERTLSREYLGGYARAMDLFYGVVEAALRKEQDVKQVITLALPELQEHYISEVEKALHKALERGFSFANANAKDFSTAFSIAKGTAKTSDFVARKTKTGSVLLSRLKSRFDDVDQQAIDVLRSRTASGQHEVLALRAIENFVGMTETRTGEILTIIADMLQGGTTTEKIAEEIRKVHSERYGDQSHTIARTEVLTAVSQGMKWNHDVLHDVFSEVEKQWFHVGDVGRNPHARAHHAEYEAEGPQPYGYKWGSILEFPRDPNGGASECVNCRCTMVSVIPDGATSNAEIILETE